MLSALTATLSVAVADTFTASPVLKEVPVADTRDTDGAIRSPTGTALIPTLMLKKIILYHQYLRLQNLLQHYQMH